VIFYLICTVLYLGSLESLVFFVFPIVRTSDLAIKTECNMCLSHVS